MDASSRYDEEVAGSFGAVWKMDEAHMFALSVAHTGRAPNPQELFAHGAHAGTQSLEIGDPSLRAERSVGIEASLRRRERFMTGALTVFAHHFRDYIFEQPTGMVAMAEEDGWRFVSSAGELDEPEGGLPVYRYVHRDARFWGAEVETVWHLHESTKWELDLRLAADMTQGREEGGDLPRIPARRAIGGISWSAGPWSAGTECQVVFGQKRTAENETASDGYTLLSAFVSRAVELGSVHVEIFLRGSNLADADARPHTSFVKELAPLAGRAAVAGVRLRF
jgi:iron complex outermembrane receptor protein